MVPFRYHVKDWKPAWLSHSYLGVDTCCIKDKPQGGTCARARRGRRHPRPCPQCSHIKPNPVLQEIVLRSRGESDRWKLSLYGFGLKRDGLRPRRGYRPHTPMRPLGIVTTPEPGLLTDKRPSSQSTWIKGVAVRANKLSRPRIEIPTVPLRMETAHVTSTKQTQQTNHRPRDTTTASVPMPNRSNSDTKKLRTRLTTQKAAMAQLPKSIRRQVPGAATI